MGKEAAATLWIRVKADSTDATRGLKATETISRDTGRRIVSDQKRATAEIASALKVLERERTNSDRSLSKSAKMATSEYDRMATAAQRSFERQSAAYRKARAEAEKPPKGGGGLSTAGIIGANIVGGLASRAIASVSSELREAGGNLIKFDAQMRNVNSTAKLSEEGFGKLRSSVLGISRDPELRKGPADLAAALYDIVGTGFEGQRALDVLKSSAVGASAGLTDTKVAASALISVLNSGFRDVDKNNPAAVMDTLFKTVEIGKGSFAELAAALPQVTRTAADFGLTFDEVGAFLATASASGQSFADASNDLLNLITKLVRPSKEASEAFEYYGIQVGASALESKGFIGVIQEIIKKVGDNKDALARLFPDMQALRGMLSSNTDQGKRFADNLDDIANAAGSADAALKEQNKSFQAQFDILKKQLELFANDYGAGFLTILTDIVQTGGDVLAFLDDMAKKTEGVGDAAANAYGFVKQLMDAFRLNMQTLRQEVSDSGQAAEALEDASVFKRLGDYAQKTNRRMGDVTVDNPDISGVTDAVFGGDDPGVYARLKRYGVDLGPLTNEADTLRLLREAQRRAEAKRDGYYSSQNSRRGFEAADAEVGNLLDFMGGLTTPGRRGGGGKPPPRGGRGNAHAGDIYKYEDFLSEMNPDNADPSGVISIVTDELARREQEAIRDLKTAEAAFRGAEGALGQAKTSGDIAQFRAAMVDAMNAIFKAQQRIAEIASDTAIIQDPNNAGRAEGQRDTALLESRQDYENNRNQIKKAQAEAEKRILEATEKDAEATEKAAENRMRQYEDYLRIEQKDKEAKLEEAETYQEALQIAKELRDNLARQSIIAFQRDLLSGDPYAFSKLGFVIGEDQRNAKQTARQLRDRFNYSLPRDSNSQFEEDGQETPEEKRRREDRRNMIWSGVEGSFRGGDIGRNLYGTAKNEVGRAAAEEMGRFASRELEPTFSKLLDGLKDNIKGLDISGKGLLSAASTLYALSGVLKGHGGKGGKGDPDFLDYAIAGASLFPAAAPYAAGAKFARQIFGFADGGSPPVGYPSWVGEREPELFIPREPGNILNQKQIAAVKGTSGGSGPSTVIYVDTINNRQDEDLLLRRLDDKRDRQAGMPGG